MKIVSSITYNPKTEYNEVGYHTTYTCYKDSIVKNGFKVSMEVDDWLGEGVYFWDNETNASWWKRKRNSGIIGRCVFVCNLTCPQDNYLDLDKNMDKFETFLNNYFSSSVGRKLKKPKFKNANECKKFFCDLYCSENKISILSFTFEHDNISKFGFKEGVIKRRQICVRNPKCISIVDIKE